MDTSDVILFVVMSLSSNKPSVRTSSANDPADIPCSQDLRLNTSAVQRGSDRFIAESNWQRTVERVHAIPTENRRIIITVGLHPNECTDILVTEAMQVLAFANAIVVKMPPEKTPSGIWRAHQEVCMNGFKPISSNVTLDEKSLEQELAGNSRPIFVRFHGSHVKNGNNHNHLPYKLEILPSLNHAQGAHSLALQTIEADFENVEYCGYPPDVICLEYWYLGNPAPAASPFVKNLIEMNSLRHENQVPQIYQEDDKRWFEKTNFAPEYLLHPVLNQRDVEKFRAECSSILVRLLQHLGKNVSKV